MPPVALTIAGSDPGGGAGLQADLRTFAALEVAGLSAVTALTIQNSRGVQAVHPVPAAVLAAQIEIVLADTRPDAVKIGMLGGAEQVRAVAEALRRFRPPGIVLDPVLASTGGVSLLDEAGRRSLLEELLPLCDLVTPNLEEACLLSGLAGGNLETMRLAARLLLGQGARNVLVTGGHLPGPPVDVLAMADGRVEDLPATRIDTVHTHGTGCLLSTAIAAFLARGMPLDRAVSAARSVLREALRNPIVIGQGRGYPGVPSGPDGRHPERLSCLRGLYVITDPDVRPDRTHEDIIRSALAGGATMVQLRDKRLSARSLIALARRLLPVAHQAGACLIVNDRVDVALASGADGVHLGPDDMEPADARRLLGPDRLIGVSVSSREEAAPLARHASYLGVGAVFGSATKEDAGPPVGTERVREIKAAFPDLPLVAIGGIGPGNIGQVAQAGADAAAVVSAVVSAPDMTKAVRSLTSKFRQAQPVQPG